MKSSWPSGISNYILKIWKVLIRINRNKLSNRDRANFEETRKYETNTDRNSSMRNFTNELDYSIDIGYDASYNVQFL